MGKLTDSKKEAKRQRLLDSAYELFLQKGVSATSIHDIVERAEVAKGTFYLYFQNKEEMLEVITYRISRHILQQAYRELESNRQPSLIDNTIFLVDWIVEYFRHNPLLLRLVQRNFSWPLLKAEMENGLDPLFQNLMRDIQESPLSHNRSQEEIFRYIFTYMEMVGSICYSSLIQHKPDTIDNMKPVLRDIIRRSLS